jgi:hypothetical protein
MPPVGFEPTISVGERPQLLSDYSLLFIIRSYEFFESLAASIAKLQMNIKNATL